MRSVITKTVKGVGWDGDEILDIDTCLYRKFVEDEEVVIVSKEELNNFIKDLDEAMKWFFKIGELTSADVIAKLLEKHNLRISN